MDAIGFFGLRDIRRFARLLAVAWLALIAAPGISAAADFGTPETLAKPGHPPHIPRQPIERPQEALEFQPKPPAFPKFSVPPSLFTPAPRSIVTPVPPVRSHMTPVAPTIVEHPAPSHGIIHMGR